MVIKKDCEIDRLKQDLVDKKGRNMKNNITLHGIKENQGEDCSSILRGILRKAPIFHMRKLTSLRLRELIDLVLHIITSIRGKLLQGFSPTGTKKRFSTHGGGKVG